MTSIRDGSGPASLILRDVRSLHPFILIDHEFPSEEELGRHWGDPLPPIFFLIKCAATIFSKLRSGTDSFGLSLFAYLSSVGSLQ